MAQRTLGLPNILTTATNSNVQQTPGTFRTIKEARLLTEFVRAPSSWVGSYLPPLTPFFLVDW